MLAAAGLLAVGSNFSPLWYTAKHSKETMRGGSELASTAETSKNGLALDYATAWSYGRTESLNPVSYTHLIASARHHRVDGLDHVADVGILQQKSPRPGLHLSLIHI